MTTFKKIVFASFSAGFITMGLLGQMAVESGLTLSFFSGAGPWVVLALLAICLWLVRDRLLVQTPELFREDR